MPSQEEKLWAMLAHLAGIAGYAGGVLQYVAPLVIYFVHKDKSKFVAFHALQSLFFQLAVLVVIGVAVAICFITCIGIPAVIPVSGAIGIGALFYCIVAAIKSYSGENFEYWLVGGWARRVVGM